MNKIKTKHNWHENTSIEFDKYGVWLRVSLNIERKLIPYFKPQYINQGKHRTVYAIKAHIPNEMICKDNLEQMQKMLLNSCMNNIKKVKSKWKRDNQS